MRLVLVRHGKSGKPDSKKFPDDNARPLTKKGIKKFKAAAAGLGNIVKPDVVLTSPMARTMQTADLLNWDADWPAAVADEALEDSSSPQETIAAIQALKGKPKVVGLVGHGPNLEALVEYLLGSKPITFEKGGAASVSISRKMKPGSGTLEWAMRPKELKQHQ